MEYTKYLIKEYKYWELYLHLNQYPYIGRCYAWAKRTDANHFSDMTELEILEFKNNIVPDFENQLNSKFPSILRFNYTVMGNEAPHLHFHMIPRYEKDFIFMGVDCKDDKKDGNYAPYEKKKISDEVIEKLLVLLKKDI
jgi:diadenosine tetraphosphate (Ap4A) HIT family hydrolase